MSVTIRAAALPDLPAVLAIERQADGAAHWSPQQYEPRLVDGTLLIAEEGHAAVGFLCAREIAGEWELENVAVIVSSRRQGVGQQLLQEFLRNARERGAVAVWLEVRASNVAAQTLYGKCGFRLTGTRRAYYQNPSEDALLYEIRWLSEGVRDET